MFPNYQILRTRLRPRIMRATERIYLPKLLAGIRTIRTEPLESLRHVDRLEEIIAGIGLTYDGRRLYGRNNRHMNFFGPGLWQIPQQLAQALSFLSTLKVQRAVEIGTYQGWTACVLAAYLQRFEHHFELTTLDPTNYFTAYPRVRGQLPITYLPGRTVKDIAGEVFDLCFIDGGHSYARRSLDYELCGCLARVCMFHDINDQFIDADAVPRFWSELKEAERTTASFREFTYHSEGAPVMGIGLRVRKKKR